MSDLYIEMTSGKTVHFNVVGEGWLGGEVGETLLHIEDPIPDLTGRKPSYVYRPDQALTKAEWIEIDKRLEDYFVNMVGYPNTLFGFGEVETKTKDTVQIYNSKTNKSMVLNFEGDMITRTQVVPGKQNNVVEGGNNGKNQ